MHNYGMFRVAAAKPEVHVCDVDYNISRIIEITDLMIQEEVDLVVFPELSITGYTIGDLCFQQSLLDACVAGLSRLSDRLAGSKTTIIVGTPLRLGNSIFNCAVMIGGKGIAGIVPKVHLPNYGEFYERRWFEPGSETLLDVNLLGQEVWFAAGQVFDVNGVGVGIEICEDLWVANPPSGRMAVAGAEVIVNLSATDEIVGKHNYLMSLLRQQSARCCCAYVYASSGYAESSTDICFSGNCIVVENGIVLAKSDRFVMAEQYKIADVDIESLRNDRYRQTTFRTETPASPQLRRSQLDGSGATDPAVRDAYLRTDPFKYRQINPYPFVDSDYSRLHENCEEITSIQAWGLARRLRGINCKRAIIGISGGLDSTLALLVTVRAFDMLGLDRKGITGVSMPGFGTSNRTRSNASLLMQELNITEQIIPIADAVTQHFKDIGHHPTITDVTYENSQARERTQILMDLANRLNAIVVGTGDLSELALGWCTYNGDQMSMYGVNASVPKTLVRYLVKGYIEQTKNQNIRKILTDILDTPISPELLPAGENGEITQKTEDTIGNYDLNDFILYGVVRHGYSPAKIYAMALRAFSDMSAEKIKSVLSGFYRRFFSQQFKRSCMPDGVKVGSVCLSPRGDWRMPSDATASLWIKEAESL